MSKITTINQQIQAIVDEFALLNEWEDRYAYLIELGQQLPALPPQYRQNEFKVHGCASQVWLAAEVTPAKEIIFYADSDAHIVRGLISILLKIFSGRTAPEIAATDAMPVFEQLQFTQYLSRNRSNGLRAMHEQIHRRAAALSP